jgi:hypothetical protein
MYSTTGSILGKESTLSVISGHTGFYSEGTHLAKENLNSPELSAKKDLEGQRLTSILAPIINPRPHRRAHFYYPGVLRGWSLLFVLVLTVALIGVTEYSVQALPHAVKVQSSGKNVVPTALLEKRATTTAAVETTAKTTTPVATTAPATKATTTAAPPQTTVVETTTPQQPQTTAAPQASTDNGNTQAQTTATDAPTTNGNAAANQSPSPSQSNSGDGGSSGSSGSSSKQSVSSIASSKVTTNSDGQVSTIVTYISDTTASSSESTPASNPKDTDNLSKQRDGFPVYKVFYGNWLPLVLAVIYKQWWSAIYARVKLIAPFIMLARPDGALARNTLHAFYASSNFRPNAIVSLFQGHWLMLWTSLGYCAVVLLTPLASEMMFLNTHWDCSNPTSDSNNPCPLQLTINVGIARGVEVILAIIVAVIITIFVMVLKLDTGVYNDPSSIASMACLTHHPEVLEDFRLVGQDASIAEIRKHLGDKRYKLDEYQRYDGTWRYGIVPTAPKAFNFGFDNSRPQPTFGEKQGKWRLLGTIGDSIFLLILLGLLGVVAGYYAAGSSDAPFNRFFETGGFGPKFILTGAAALIALNWKRLSHGGFCSLTRLLRNRTDISRRPFDFSLQ